MSAIRILLVDDVESWRSSISSMLRAEPSFVVVLVASDGLKAVQAAEKLQPAVVLLDIGLPGLNGIGAGGWIRRVAPFAKIVFVTMERDPDIVAAAWRSGAWGYGSRLGAPGAERRGGGPAEGVVGFLEGDKKRYRGGPPMGV